MKHLQHEHPPHNKDNVGLWRSHRYWKGTAFWAWTTLVEPVIKGEHPWLYNTFAPFWKQTSKTQNGTLRALESLLVLTWAGCFGEAVTAREMGWSGIDICPGISHTLYCVWYLVLRVRFKNSWHQSGNLGSAWYRTYAQFWIRVSWQAQPQDFRFVYFGVGWPKLRLLRDLNFGDFFFLTGI